jgi:hypothetical protein
MAGAGVSAGPGEIAGMDAGNAPVCGEAAGEAAGATRVTTSFSCPSAAQGTAPSATIAQTRKNLLLFIGRPNLPEAAAICN